MNHKLEQKLYKKYPSLFRERNMPDTYSLMCYGFCHSDGWYDIVDEMCSSIMEIDKEEVVSFCQIKEKFGSLRVYYNVSDSEKIDSKKLCEIIYKAEEKSGIICELCGAPGKLREAAWIHVYCDECESKYKKTNI